MVKKAKKAYHFSKNLKTNSTAVKVCNLLDALRNRRTDGLVGVDCKNGAVFNFLLNNLSQYNLNPRCRENNIYFTVHRPRYIDTP